MWTSFDFKRAFLKATHVGKDNRVCFAISNHKKFYICNCQVDWLFVNTIMFTTHLQYIFFISEQCIFDEILMVEKHSEFSSGLSSMPLWICNCRINNLSIELVVDEKERNCLISSWILIDCKESYQFRKFRKIIAIWISCKSSKANCYCDWMNKTHFKLLKSVGFQQVAIKIVIIRNGRGIKLQSSHSRRSKNHSNRIWNRKKWNCVSFIVTAVRRGSWFISFFGMTFSPLPFMLWFDRWPALQGSHIANTNKTHNSHIIVLNF